MQDYSNFKKLKKSLQFIFMKEYIVISNELLIELQNEVSKNLNEGWMLAGGVSVAYKHEHIEHVHGHLVFAQAMQR